MPLAGYRPDDRGGVELATMKRMAPTRQRFPAPRTNQPVVQYVPPSKNSRRRSSISTAFAALLASGVIAAPVVGSGKRIRGAAVSPHGFRVLAGTAQSVLRGQFVVKLGAGRLTFNA